MERWSSPGPAGEPLAYRRILTVFFGGSGRGSGGMWSVGGGGRAVGKGGGSETATVLGRKASEPKPETP